MTITQLLKDLFGHSTPQRNVALVLGGGGARGFAHIGAIEALTEHGYRISSVAGTSMGRSSADSMPRQTG
jgi:NTE family protein